MITAVRIGPLLPLGAADALVVGWSGSGAGDRDFGQGCTWPEERETANDDPDIDVYEGVLRCWDEISDLRVTGMQEWTLVDPHHIHHTTWPPHRTVRGLGGTDPR